MSKKSKNDLGPLGLMLDLAGAAVMRTVAKHQIIEDYKNGKGKKSAMAATAFFTRQAMRKGSDGMLGLGGLYGVNSAIKAVERQRAAAASTGHAQAGSIPVRSASVNDNSEAWRLNTAEGREYGLDPNDFETREEYLCMLDRFRASEDGNQGNNNIAEEKETQTRQTGPVHVYCRVSLLNTGENRYYLADRVNVTVGNTVKVPDGDAVVKGIVLTVEQHSAAAAPADPEKLSQILPLA